MSFESVQFPAMLPKDPRKRWLKIHLGQIVSLLQPAYARRIAAGDLPERLGTRERLIIAALVHRHQTRGTLDALAPLHAWLWQGRQALAFHEAAKARFDKWWLQHHSAIVEPLQKLIDTPQSLYRTLCEIGCGSGLVLEDLAKRLTQLDAFIGLDLSPDQTQRNRERAVDHRIRFEAGDATVWIPEHASSGTVFLTVAGVLEYLPRHKLSLLFETIGRTLAPSVIAVIEPIPADYDLEKEIDSRPYGPEHSLGHNYPHLLRAAGFDIRFQQVQKLDRSTHLLVVAEYVGRPHSVSSTQGVAS